MNTWPRRSAISLIRFSILVAILGICLVYSFVIASLRYDKTLGNGLGTMAESLNWHFDEIIRSIAAGKPIQLRKVDLHSVGSPYTEFQLLEFRHWVQMYALSSGKLPERSSDLERTNREAWLKADQKKLIENIARKCQIFTLGNDSYLLNCDGARVQGLENAQHIVEPLGHEAERFQIVDGHVFLYAPPLARAAPLTR